MATVKKIQRILRTFRPYVPEEAKIKVFETLGTSWIGQGPQVNAFEQEFEETISHKHMAVAVNSCTSALHLSYLLANIQEGDEVIVPVFTCTATIIPLLYLKAKIIFADIQKDTLNIDPIHVLELMNSRVKAIVCVDFGGNPCDLEELRIIADSWNIPLIEDAAQAVGATYHGLNVGEIADFTTFSFQAIKTITTGDGGMLTLRNILLTDKAKRLRWFGIDREAKLEDRWKNDITEVGYKYQMTDIAASMGRVGLKKLPDLLAYQFGLFSVYRRLLKQIPGITLLEPRVDRTSSHWLATVLVEDRDKLKAKLKEYNVDSSPVHYRCDKYSVFGGRVGYCKVMDEIEDKYLALPIHQYLSVHDIEYICKVIQGGW